MRFVVMIAAVGAVLLLVLVYSDQNNVEQNKSGSDEGKTTILN